MRKLKFKVGQTVMRTGVEYIDSHIFKKGVIIKINRITECKYFYAYLNCKNYNHNGNAGNCCHAELEDTCIEMSGAGKILYE